MLFIPILILLMLCYYYIRGLLPFGIFLVSFLLVLFLYVNLLILKIPGFMSGDFTQKKGNILTSEVEEECL